MISECKKPRLNNPLGMPKSFYTAHLKSQVIYLTGQLDSYVLETIRSFNPGVHKGEGVILPRNIEYYLSLNLKYIFPQKMDSSLPISCFDEMIRKVRVAWQHRHMATKDRVSEYLKLRKMRIDPEKSSFAIEEALAIGRQSLLDFEEKDISTFDMTVNKGTTWYLPTMECNKKQLLSWMHSHQIMAFITDKNLGIATTTVTWYLAQVSSLLNSGYEKMEELPWDDLASSIVILSSPRHWMNKQMVEFLNEVPNYVHIPTFHGIPKVHKNPWKLRPIVPQHSFCTRNIAMTLHALLQPLRSCFPWIVTSSRKFVSNLDRWTNLNKSNHGYFVGIDVVSMYTNILTHHLVDALQILLVDHSGYSDSCIKWIIEAVVFINDNTFFQFDGQVYRQTQGIAMGTAIGPCLADLFMAIHEERLGIHRLGFYNRYIDDSFLITTIDRHELEEGFKIPGLSLTYDYNKEQSFLDCFIHKHGNEVCWKPFTKRMNHYQYLPWESCHPSSVKKGLIKTELLRFKHLSKKKEYFEERRDSLYNLLRLRGYPIRALNAWTRQITWSSTTLSVGIDTPKPSDTLLCPSEYNPIWEHVRLQDHWDKTLQSLERRGFFSNQSIEFSFPLKVVRSLKRTMSLWDVVRILNRDLLKKTNTKLARVSTSTTSSDLVIRGRMEI